MISNDVNCLHHDANFIGNIGEKFWEKWKDLIVKDVFIVPIMAESASASGRWHRILLLILAQSTEQSL